MNIEEYRDFCISFKGVTEEFPFDSKTLVFKVGGKIFALANVDSFEFINLKCAPEKAIQLREEFDFVKPGYHMSKKHWNSVYLNSPISKKQLKEWITDSFNLVFGSLRKKTQIEIGF